MKSLKKQSPSDESPLGTVVIDYEPARKPDASTAPARQIPGRAMRPSKARQSPRRRSRVLFLL
jgi:hypothetical protein